MLPLTNEVTLALIGLLLAAPFAFWFWFAAIVGWRMLFGESSAQLEPGWEAVAAKNSDGEIVGYQVRWSEPDGRGRYLWVGHYFVGELSAGWCQSAAESHAARFNAQGKVPWEIEAGRRWGETVP